MDEMTNAGSTKEPISFSYCDAKGTERVWTLIWWTEKGAYICGGEVSGSIPRTFRKDRVSEYQLGLHLLSDPHTPAPPRIMRTSAPDARPQILFTGFNKLEKAEMELRAMDAGLHVVKESTVRLTFLCCGPNAGWRKIERAREAGSFIMNLAQWEQLLATGELPADHFEVG